jgi:hypothetical protein
MDDLLIIRSPAGIFTYLSIIIDIQIVEFLSGPGCSIVTSHGQE